jgi:predicted amidohydrolase YtcJ
MHADLVLYNGIIRTQNEAVPQASTIAVRDGHIIAVDSDSDIRDLLKPGGESINLDGKLVLPGLVDAHVHLSLYADALHTVSLFGTHSAEACVERVAKFAAERPAGEWVRGWGWLQDEWANPAFPTAAQLDSTIPDHPVYLTAHSGHAAWANTRALLLAGISAETPDPAGGRISRDSSGKPDGVLFEEAMGLVTRVIPGMIGHFVTPEFNPDTIAAQAKVAIERAHRGGLTGIHDFDGARAFQAYQLLHSRGELSLRIVKNIPVALLDHALAVGLRWGFGDERLRIGGVKQFADGALGPRTAWMLSAYQGEPDNTGICVTDPEEMAENVARASAGGLPSTIHAIGDRAVHEVLNAYESVRKQEAERGIWPSQMRHRIEHVQIIHPDDARRLAQLGVIASMQPNHATSDMPLADRYWGDRADYSYNWRLQLDAGATLALGSDAPIEPIEPLPNIQAAVTRRRADGTPGPDGWRSGPEGQGRLSVDEAVRGFTRGPAYTAGVEDRLGQIAPGFLADLTILGRDIYTCDPMEIGQTAVCGTLLGGEWVWRDF